MPRFHHGSSSLTLTATITLVLLQECHPFFTPQSVPTFKRVNSRSSFRHPTPLSLSLIPPEEESTDPDSAVSELRSMYPDLEFVDYADNDYVIDQGLVEADPLATEATDDTEEQIEAMREDRRRRNDEYQYETYYAKALCNGIDFKGEWTRYTTSTFNGGGVDANGLPRLSKGKKVLKVVSRSEKCVTDENAEWRVDGEYINQEESLVMDEEDSSEDAVDFLKVKEAIHKATYWPNEIKHGDFRGPMGIMGVGNGYTICNSVPLNGDSSENILGPFSELRTEVGIFSEDIRFRVKFDYRTMTPDGSDESKSQAPPLHLNSMTVCRECQNVWPKSDIGSGKTQALFGPPGANGGLYDPPPVGTQEQSKRYMMLDLEGGASVLFPHTIDQDPTAFDGNGWVTTLDWNSGTIRYQADRKTNSGVDCKGLFRLELSEVQAENADTWRPTDGGTDMRQ